VYDAVSPTMAPMIQTVLKRSIGQLDRMVSTAILLREAARTSRRWQTHAARTGFSAALIAVLLLGIHGAVTATSSSLVDSANLAWLGRGLFIGFAITQLGLATLLAPLMTATAVIEEAEANTLDLLVLTRLDAGQIVAGKVVSRLLVLTTVVLGSLPITALVVNLGGVSGLEVVTVTVHTLTTVAVMGLLGAFFALFTRSPMLAVMASACYAVPFFVVLPGAYALVTADTQASAHFSPFAGAAATDLSALITPLSYVPSMAVLWGLLLPLFELKSARASLTHAFSHELWQTRRWLVGVGVLAAVSTTLGLAVPAIYLEASGSSPLPWQLTLVARAWVWVLTTAIYAAATWAYLRVAFDVVDGLDGIFHPRRDGGEIAGPVDVGANPVWWREARFRAWSRTAAPLVSTWLLVLMAVFQTGWWVLPGGILSVALGNAAVTLLLAAWMGSRAVADERRRGTLEPLLTTTLSSHRIVAGKVAGVWFATLPLLLFNLPLLVVGVPHFQLLRLLDQGTGEEFLWSGVHAGLTWCWLVAVWGALVAGSMIVGIRVRNPRSAFGVVLVATLVFLMVPASLGRLFPETLWVALPARMWAPPLAGGAGALTYAGSTLGWAVAAIALYGALSVRLRPWALRTLVALGVAVGVTAAPTARAQPNMQAEMERLNKLKMRVTPLADGLYRQDGWVTVSVVMENRGSATEGTLSVSEEAAGDTHVWSRRVELAEGARKELSFVFRATGYGRDRTLTYVAPDGRTAVDSFRLAPLGPDAVAIGVVGTDALGLPAALRDATGSLVPGHRPRPPTSGTRSVRTGLLLADQLPTASAALGGLDWIVWPDADPSVLEQPQLRALAAWVADGGQLLLTVTDTHRQVNDSLLAAMLPAEVGPPTLQRLTEMDPRLALTDVATPVSAGDLVPDGRALGRTDQGRPVWSVRAWGLGAVHLLAADLSLDPLHAADRGRLFRALLFLPPSSGDLTRRLADDAGLRRALNAYEPTSWQVDDYSGVEPYLDWESELRDRLDDIPGVSPLPLSWLVVFSGLYLLVIGPLDYFVLRALGRQPLTWVTFPVAIATFTGLAILGTRYTKGSTAILTRVEVVDVLPTASTWRGETFFGVFSTRKVDLVVASGFDDAVLAPLAEPGYLPTPRLQAGHGPGQLAYRAETWTLAYGRSSWTQPSEGRMQVERTSDGVRVTNDLGIDLSDAAVLVGEHGMIRLGPLPRGAPAEVAYEQTADPVPTTVSDDASFVAKVLGAPPLPRRGDLSTAAGDLLFVGWTRSSVEALQLTGLAPVQKPLLVVRQALPGPDHPIAVRDRRLTLQLEGLPEATRVTVSCFGGGDMTPHIAPVQGDQVTVAMGDRPQPPCQVQIDGNGNTWFGTVEQAEGTVRCHQGDYELECEAVP